MWETHAGRPARVAPTLWNQSSLAGIQHSGPLQMGRQHLNLSTEVTLLSQQPISSHHEP